MHAPKQAGFGQALQNLGKRLLRNAVSVSQVFGADGTMVSVLGQVAHRDQAVVGFLGELEHASVLVRPERAPGFATVVQPTSKSDRIGRTLILDVQRPEKQLVPANG